MVLVQCGLAQSGSTYHRPNVVCHAMSLCAACAGTADLPQPPCTLWCRLRAAGECRRHAGATAAYPQTVSWPPLPFSPTNTNHFFIKTLWSAWAYCPARYSVHSFLSFYLVLHLLTYLSLFLPIYRQHRVSPNSSPILSLPHFSCLFTSWHPLSLVYSFPPLHPWGQRNGFPALYDSKSRIFPPLFVLQVLSTLFPSPCPFFPYHPSTLIFPCMFFNYQTSLTMSSTLGPDVVLETLGKTESAFGVDLSYFDACEQPGINLAESSRESSSILKVNHPQIPDFSADSKETFSFLRILSACLQVNQHPHVGLRDFIRKSLQPVSFGSGLTSSCKLILSLILLFIFFLFNHCFSMGSFLSSFTLISPTSTLWVSGFIKPLSPILTGYHCPLPSNIL